MAATVNITVTSTAFSNSTTLQSDVAANEYRWQVAHAASFATATIIHDTWYQTTHTTSYTFSNNGYRRVYVRMQFRDNYGTIGAWSSTLTVTVGTGGRRPVTTGTTIVVPEPVERYSRENEAQFRKTIERALQDTQQLINAEKLKRGYKVHEHLETDLVDDATYLMPFFGVQRVGQIRVSSVGATTAESGYFHFHGKDGAATVTKLVGTTNTAATDSDTDLCVYTDGSDVYVKNRLGETVDVIVEALWL